MAKEEKEFLNIDVEKRQQQLRRVRSTAEKVYNDAVKKGTGLKAGAGKGLEPKPWCPCHNRNPCPLDKELNA